MIPALRILLTGDAFGGKFLPALSRVDGGDGVEYPNTLTKALPLTRDIDMIVTGHSGVAKPEDLAVHRDFMRDFLESDAPGQEGRPDGGGCRQGVETAGAVCRLQGRARQGIGGHGVDLPAVAIASQRVDRGQSA